MGKQKLSGIDPALEQKLEDLLLYLSYREQFPEEYQAAVIEFHRRYMGIIYKISNNACRFFSNKTEMATEIASNVFVLACEQAVDFPFPKDNAEEIVEKSFKEWLVKIVAVELKRFTSHNPDRKKSFAVDGTFIEGTGMGDNDFEDVSPEPEDNNGSDYPISKESVTQVLELLKPRDKDIIMAYLIHVNRKGAHLPDEIMQGLCSKYGTTSFNIRKIKQRVFDKIRNLNVGKA